MKETKQFQAESKELLNLMIHSIYTNKEIFLRELISNASDAIDKYKYLALTSEGKTPVLDYEINIEVNKDERSITISDNGVGMSKKDLETNLGTIAKSGSKDFVKKYKDIKDQQDMNIIGQFGVGFYSAFMVAKQIEVTTKKYGEKAYQFSSDGVKEYSIEQVEKETSGTSIKILLKKDTKEEDYSKFLDEHLIKELVKKYSDYIRYPIKMEVEETVEDGTKSELKKVTLNAMVPLWKQNKKDVTDEQINSFYKEKFHDYEDPCTSLFLNVDGMISYSAMLFIPSHPPHNLYSENYEKGLELYAKGIFIKDKCKELIPDYLKFVKGLVDSNDFNLNISREILQNSPVLKKIEDNIENKVVNKLKEMLKEDKEKYLKFFEHYGDHIKYGIYTSFGSKKELLEDTLVFNTLNEEKPISLKEYKDSLKEGQKYIYYVSGKSLEALKMLPQIEKYKKEGINVLLFVNQVDEFAIMMMRDYQKVEFKNITNENADDVSTEEKEKIEKLSVDNKRILDNIKEELKGQVDDVVFSSKLVDSPVCISTKEGLSLSMEETLSNDPNNKQNAPKATKVLEINPDHELFKALETIKDNDEEIKMYGSLLYDEALMLEGIEIKDKKEFVRKLNQLMLKTIK